MFRALSVFGLILLVSSGTASAQTTTQVNLAWDASSDPNVVGYIIEYGTASGVYTKSVDVGSVLQFTLQGLTIGKTYYLTVRAYDQTRSLSPRANEISYFATAAPGTCVLSFSTTTQTVSAAAGNGTFTLSTPTGCSWVLGSNVSWLTPLSAAGSGTQAIAYNVTPNLSKQPRVAIVYSGPRSVVVTQRGRMKSDFDGDGRNDLLWQNSATGELSVWRMDGTTIKRGDYISPANVGDGNWKIMGALDANRDAQPDIVLQHDHGEVMIWQMAGETRSQAVLLSDSVSSDPRWRIVGTGDMDGDGFDDLIWQHSDGRVNVWYLNGYTMREEAIIATVSDPRWRVAAMEDFNGDGKIDILWRHTSWGQFLVWNMDDRTFLSSGMHVVMANHQWQVAAVGDFSGDGKPDLMWRNAHTGELAAWIVVNEQIVDSRPLNPGRIGDLNWHIVGPR